MRKVRRRKIKVFRKILGATVFAIIVLGIAFVYLQINYPGSKLINPVSEVSAAKEKEIKNALEKKSIAFESVSSTKSGYLISIKNNGSVIISSKKKISEQISSLQLILSRLTIEGKRFKSLDLSFDKPVIVF